jgi:hypothetical protein
MENGIEITMNDLCDFNLDFMKEELKSQSTMEENDNSNSNSNNSIIQNMKHFPSVNQSRFNFETDDINNQNKSQNLNIEYRFESKQSMKKNLKPKKNFKNQFNLQNNDYQNINNNQNNQFYFNKNIPQQNLINQMNLTTNNFFNINNINPIVNNNLFFNNPEIQNYSNLNFKSNISYIEPINIYYSNPYFLYNNNNLISKSSFNSNFINNNYNANSSDDEEENIISYKKTKSNQVVSNFDTLEELLANLKGGKQIGNYIKSRNNTETMIKLIKKLPSEKITELLYMIKTKLKDIMISNNKFSQKLFELCNSDQRLLILNTIKDHFIEISFNKWGSYSLQSLIKIISLPEEQEILKKCIEGRVYELAMDKQANFILQKLILLFNEKGILSITNEIFQIFSHLIYNSNGIGLLKNLVVTNKSNETRKKFVNKVIENLPNIINNQTGHTLILQMMEKWDFETCKSVILKIFENISKYAILKYSSIVVIKCILFSDIKTIKIASKILFYSENLDEIIKSENGKEIVKKMIMKLPKKNKNEIYEIINKYYYNIPSVLLENIIMN